mmetsp:Transcript_5394/g.12214  ORF Transcript_5394/g.12214 Transcript_5394/m.12214 type:complete len:665 (+) Transcript_5394:131-2125(+)
MMAGMGVPAFPPAAAAPGPVGAAAAEPGADAGDGKVEVAFRMIAPNARTGHVIGTGGATVTALRTSTGAQIKVFDKVNGVDESTILVWGMEDPVDATVDPFAESAAACLAETETKSGSEVASAMGLHLSPAALAVISVHELLVEEGAPEFDAKLLVSKGQVGCLMGKGGAIINSMRVLSGAQIHIKRGDEVPGCAGVMDQMVWVHAPEPSKVLKALGCILRRLRASPPPAGFEKKTQAKGLSGSMMAPGAAPGIPAFAGVPGVSGGTPGVEIVYRLLIPGWKTGHLIGRGGATIRQLRESTNATIQLVPAAGQTPGMPTDKDLEYIISIGCTDDGSAFCPAQNALMQVVGKLVAIRTTQPGQEAESTGPPIARILIQRSAAGCLMGKGGSIMAALRQRTGAFVKLLTDPGEMPPCAETEDSVLQVGGRQDGMLSALQEISARLRENAGRAPAARPGAYGAHANTGAPGGAYAGGGFANSAAGSMGGAGAPAAEKTIMQFSVPNNKIGNIIGRGGSKVQSIRDQAGASVKIHDSHDGQERVIEFGGTAEQVHAAHALAYQFMMEDNGRPAGPGGGGGGGGYHQPHQQQPQYGMPQQQYGQPQQQYAPQQYAMPDQQQQYAMYGQQQQQQVPPPAPPAAGAPDPQQQYAQQYAPQPGQGYPPQGGY